MENGIAELETARRELVETLDLLTQVQAPLPSLFSPIESQDDRARQRIQKASRRAWKEFEKLVPEKTRSEIRPHIEKSEKAAVAALNYLEDTDKAHEAHEAIHHAAFIRSGLYGCPITYRDGDFWTDCSIDISHLRLGMSIGMTSASYCSVCNRRAEDCDHVMGVSYNVVAIIGEDGSCNICDLPECPHENMSTYPVIARGFVRDINIHETSMVSRPRYPLARITEWTKEIPQRYREYAEAHVLNCDGCMGPCKGFNESGDWPLPNSMCT